MRTTRPVPAMLPISVVLLLALILPPADADAGPRRAPDTWPLVGARGVPTPAALREPGEGIVRAMHDLRIFVLARVWNELLTMPAVGALGGPDSGLSWQQTLDFADGRMAFRRVFTVEDGLGPHFNQVACASCHMHPTLGGEGKGMDLRIHVRAPAHDANDTVSARMYAIAGAKLEDKGAGGQRRRTPPLFGLGRLDAIPDATLAALVDPDDRNQDGVRGKLNARANKNGVTGPARFGHKSNDLNLLRFHAGALQGEMGITNRLGRARAKDGDAVADPEVPDRFVVRIDGYVRGLAPPPALPATPARTRGRRTFAEIGCTGCHRERIGAVEGAYTDLLLHDVGAKLSDGLTDNKAGPADWRTAPLWGLRHRSAYLHDQRTTSLTEAITLHGGEAARSAAAFAALPARRRADLMGFLESL